MSTTLDIRTSESQPFIILPTFIDDKGPFNFVLDTGANVSIITEKLAEALEIKNAEVKEALGVGHVKAGVPVGQVDSITVGGARVEGAKVGIMKALPKCVGEGVLGHDFLRHFKVRIDYRLRTLTLITAEEHEREDVPSESIPLQLARPDRPLILMDIRINARKSYRCILDTGASQTVVSPALAEEMALRNQQKDTLVGAGGVVTSSFGILESLGIGATLLRNVRVMVSDVFPSIAQAAGVSIDAIVGYNVLRRFKLTIDYPNEKLRLQPQIQ